MVNRPEDTPKVIALIVTIIAIIAFMFMRIQPLLISRQPVGVAQAAASDGAAPANPNALVASVPGDMDSVGPTPMEALDIDSGIPAQSTRDPFKPPPPARTQPVMNLFAPPRAQGRPNPLTLWPGGALPPIGPKPAPAPVPLPTVELKGVVPGNPAIAVVNVDGQTFYKQEGERLAEGLILARISEAGIILHHQGRNMVVEVGHTLKPPTPGMPTAMPAGSANPFLPEAAHEERSAPPPHRETPKENVPQTKEPATAPVQAAQRAAPSASPRTTQTAQRKIASNHGKRRPGKRRRYARRPRIRSVPPTALAPQRFTGRRL